MNVLITGGAGFLGMHLAQRLVVLGNRVVLYDRSFDQIQSVSRGPAHDLAFANQVVLVRGDVSDDILISSTIEQHQIEIVVHLAAILTAACAADPLMAVRVNCMGAAAVMTASARSMVRKVIFGSSVAVFSKTHPAPSDVSPLTPPSIYGATKAFAEHLASALMQANPALDLLGLRFGWIYGPGRRRGWNDMQNLLSAFALEEPQVTYPDYATANDWTYVSDAVEAICQCLAAPRASITAYNVPGDYRRVQDAVKYLQRRFPRVQAVPVQAELPNVAWNFRPDRIVTEVGFRPQVPLEKGLDLTIQAIREAHGLPKQIE
jgi:UDP-glucose 4-epimerase